MNRFGLFWVPKIIHKKQRNIVTKQEKVLIRNGLANFKDILARSRESTQAISWNNNKISTIK